LDKTFMSLQALLAERSICASSNVMAVMAPLGGFD
jgi:deoxycytidylate deaminase